jgi:hypothetical protein
VFKGFWLGCPNAGDHWEDLGIGGRINIKMDLREMGINGVNWIQLTQGRVQWRACLNTVMNHRFP